MRGPGPASTQRADLSHHLVEIAVDPGATEAAGADVLASRLWSLGANGIEEHPNQLIGAFDDADVARSAAAVLGADTLVEVADDTGLDAWRAHAGSMMAGPFVVHPPWVAPAAAGRAVSIDPAHAFGSGSHPSTRLALRTVAEAVAPGDRVLDLGCGSGVLAIGAAMLGANVVATDIDDEARRVTRRNAQANGVAERVLVCVATEVCAPFDTVVANLTINHHEAAAANARRWAVSSQTVIASGVLAGSQVARVAAAHRRAVATELVDGEWSCVTLH